jgi:hypothetical protein
MFDIVGFRFDSTAIGICKFRMIEMSLENLSFIGLQSNLVGVWILSGEEIIPNKNG